MKLKTINEHKILYRFLCTITFIIFFPFVILELIDRILEKILNFIGNVRCSIVHRIMEFLFEKW